MADVVEVEKKGEIEEINEEPRKALLIPEICMYNNEETTGYVIEVMLPGVEKDTVKVRMTEDFFFIYYYYFF
jgi:HSP20 family molecular chaperone IbpA